MSTVLADDAARPFTILQNVPIHINVGHTRDDDGKPWKHLSAHCPLLREHAEAGFPAKKIRNPDNNRPPAEHKYARCPECFSVGGGELSNVTRTPRVLETARRLERRKAPGAFWVYNVLDRSDRKAQVGMAGDLYRRLRQRWLATRKSRFGEDCIPWLYDKLSSNPGYEPALEASAFPSRVAALAAERAKREQLVRAGWDEGTMV